MMKTPPASVNMTDTMLAAAVQIHWITVRHLCLTRQRFKKGIRKKDLRDPIEAVCLRLHSVIIVKCCRATHEITPFPL